MCHFFAIEVGARGFNSTHVRFCLKSLGFPPKFTKEMLENLSRAALQSSYHIWLARDDRMWDPPLVEWKSRFSPPSLTTTSYASMSHSVILDTLAKKSCVKQVSQKVPAVSSIASPKSKAVDNVEDTPVSQPALTSMKDQSLANSEPIDFVISPLPFVKPACKSGDDFTDSSE